MFRKINEMRRPQYVVDQILTSIHNGSIKPGDRLPSESQLAELIGVGRTSIREGLAVLRMMKVVETKVGDGTYVRRSAGLNDVAKAIDETIKKSEEVFQLQEARAAFECGTIRFAAERIQDGDIAKLKEVLDEMRQSVQDSRYEDFVRHHKEFHLLIARATRNTVIENTALSFLKIMEKEGWRDLETHYFLPDREDSLTESVEIHTRIFEALRARNEGLATKLMQKHFIRYW